MSRPLSRPKSSRARRSTTPRACPVRSSGRSKEAARDRGDPLYTGAAEALPHSRGVTNEISIRAAETTQEWRPPGSAGLPRFHKEDDYHEMRKIAAGSSAEYAVERRRGQLWRQALARPPLPTTSESRQLNAPAAPANLRERELCPYHTWTCRTRWRRRHREHLTPRQTLHPLPSDVARRLQRGLMAVL